MLKKASAIFLILMMSVGFLGLAGGTYAVHAQEDDFYVDPYEDDFWVDDATLYEDDFYYEDTLTTTDEDALAAFVGMMTAMFIPLLCVGLITYVVYALALYTIGGKLSVDGGWMAWVPFLNIYYFVKVADLGILWFILTLIFPIVSIYVWMKIAERRGWEGWLGLLTIIPVLNYIMPLYFAWGEPSGGGGSAPAQAAPVEKAEETPTQE